MPPAREAERAREKAAAQAPADAAPPAADAAMAVDAPAAGKAKSKFPKVTPLLPPLASAPCLGFGTGMR